MSRPAKTIAALAAAAAALIAPVTAGAAYSQPETISDPESSASYPELAIAPSGEAIVAWAARVPAARVQARRISAGGGKGPILGVSPLGARPPISIGVDEAGTATVVWSRNADIEAARVDSDGTVTPRRLIARADGPDTELVRPVVAVAREGTATIAWRRYDRTGNAVEAARLDGDGDVGPVQTLARGRGVSRPNLAVDRRGNVTVAWRVRHGDRHVIAAARLDRRGKLTKLGRISQRSGRNAEEQVAVDRAGAALVVWRRFGRRDAIQAARISPRGRVSKLRNLARSGRGKQTPYFIDPAVAFGPDRRARVAWSRIGRKPRGRLWFDRLDRRGRRHGRPLPISDRGSDADSAELAVDSGGRTTIAWDDFSDGEERILAATVASGGRPAQPEPIRGADGTAFAHALALDPRDRPWVTWWEMSRDRIELVVGDG